MSRKKDFSSPDMPLTPAVFYILLSLATKERHGYGIMKQVDLDSKGKVRLGPGTLYGAIKRLVDEKLVAEKESLSDERRRYYKLTDKGMRIFKTELTRFDEAVSLAKKRKLLESISLSTVVFI